MITNYFRTARRSLLYNKKMAALNIAGLAIGMTAAILIFLWVDNEFSFDRYQPAADRTYSMNTRLPAKGLEWEGAPLLLADAVKKEVPGVEAITRLTTNQPVFNVHGEPQYEQRCAYVDPNWFSVFSYSFIKGDASALAGDPYGLVLTASEAKKFFGSQEAIGQTVKIDSLLCTVRGIVADAPANSTFHYDAYLPIAALVQNPQWRLNGEEWGNANYRIFVRLAPSMPVVTAEANMTATLQRYSHDDEHSQSISLEGLTALHFDNNQSGSMFEHGNYQVVVLFSLLGLVILIVACINYVNLTTAKASLRSKEVSIRKIIGAERRQLFWQFVAESVLVSGMAAAVSIALLWLALPAFAQLTGTAFTGAFQSTAIWKVLGITLSSALVLNSIYPALLLSSFRPLNIFRGITILRVKDSYLRKGLVVVQFCVSLFLLTGTVVIYRQLQFVQQTNPGYDRQQVLMARLPMNADPGAQQGDAAGRIAVMKQQLLDHSPIEQVSLVSQPVVRIGSSNTGADWEGRDTTATIRVAQLSADADLPATLHLQLAEGRWFRNGDKADEQNYVLNETAVRQLHIRQPVIGAYFSMHGVKGKIVGVIKDFHFKSLHEKTGPLAIFNDPGWGRLFLIRTAPQSASAAVTALQSVWKKQFPGRPLEYSFMDEQFNDLYKADAMASTLVLLFSVMAVFISALGLFGLAAFAAERRTREIGIRKVLGATTVSLGGLLSKEFIKLVIVAIAIATPLAFWAMNSWLQNFAYRVGLSWWMFAAPGAFVLIMALTITGWQAVRVAWKNPVHSLRTE